MLTPADMPSGYLLVTATRTDVEIQDAGSGDLFIAGGLSPTGTLTFEVRAVNPSDGSRGTVRGRVLFDLMVRHFGPGVRAIQSLWIDGTNLDGFNRAIAAGLSAETAAAGTWTGRQAARHGFTRVVIGFKIGSFGYYGWVEATFVP